MYEKERHSIIRRLKKPIKYAVNNRFRLRIDKLGLLSLSVIGFLDSLFARKHDFSSQLGYVVFLGDPFNSVIPLSFKSYKALRVTRSAMSGKVIAFSDMFDTYIAIG